MKYGYCLNHQNTYAVNAKKLCGVCTKERHNRSAESKNMVVKKKSNKKKSKKTMDLILHEDERQSYEAYKSLVSAMSDHKEKFKRKDRLLSIKPKSTLSQKARTLSFPNWSKSKNARYYYRAMRAKCVELYQDAQICFTLSEQGIKDSQLTIEI